LFTQEQLLARVLAYTVEIAEKKPDSVIISRLGAREVWETGVNRATMSGQELYAEAMLRSQNSAEGHPAYHEKRKPRRLPSYL
jgi:enoyl-CoA hydratase/carnithine racemase